MKVDVNGAINRHIAKSVTQTCDTIKRLWELSTLLVLHREFGFGKDRLKRFVDTLRETYSEIQERASVTDAYDRNKREFTNIDEAIIKVLRELRRDGIDHRELLGTDEQLVMVDENGKQVDLDEFLDNLEKIENERSVM